MMKLITEACYKRMVDLYINEEFLLYEFPCGCLPPFTVGEHEFVGTYWRDMTITTPKVVDDLWEYTPW